MVQHQCYNIQIWDKINSRLGVEVTNPVANYSLDLLNHNNYNEIYRNGTPISSTLSLFLPLAGGISTGVLTGTSISATNVCQHLVFQLLALH